MAINNYLVIGVNPTNNESKVPLNKEMTITFAKHMDVTTLTTSNLILKQVNGSIVPTVISYQSNTMTAKITLEDTTLNAGTQYQIVVVGSPTGIKSILGDYMTASRTYEFTTSYQTTLSNPTSLNIGLDNGYPTVSYLQPVEFDVASSLLYEVLISTSNDPLYPVVWPSTGDINRLASTVLNVPKRLSEGTYYAHVRAINGDAVSSWTSKQFSVEAAVVSTNPMPNPTPGGDLFSFEVLDTYPRRNEVNITPEKILVVFSSNLDMATVTEDSVYVIKKASKETLSLLDFMTEYSPSKKVAAIIEPTEVPNMIELTIALEDDSEYTVVIRGTVKSTDGGTIGNAYHWSFMTKFTRLYGDIEMVRADIGAMADGITDKVLYKTMRDSSIHAYNIVSQTGSFIAGDYLSGKAPYHVHQYVRFRTAYDLVVNGQIKMSAGSGTSIQLGDLKVANKSSESGGQSSSLKDLRDRIKPWEDALHGHNNRGYAKPVAVVKGESGAAYPEFLSGTEFADLGQ